jgi:probable F420-dependent oxidoreductase
VPGGAVGLLDPFAALSWVAAHTQRIRLGTGICLVPQRNPVYTAKSVADLDYLSGGRVDFGVGIGWLREEFEALDVPFERRAARTSDYVRLMKSLWCDETPSYEGEFHTLPECKFGPKPVQKPHPPIIFGGNSEPALRRVAELGQGWYAHNFLPEAAAPGLAALSTLIEESGRAQAEVQRIVSPFFQEVDRGALERYRELGVDQVLLPLIAADTDGLERCGDELAELVAPLR